MPEIPPAAAPATRRRREGLWNLLLLVPVVASLWVPFFNRVEPTVGGFPFFYWYQFLWIVIGACLTAIVYFATRR
jgi:hypothetical protein